MLINVAWDTSGSMIEEGKLWIARGVARAIEQYVRLGYGKAELRLVAWGDEARFVDWAPDQEFPSELMAPEGSTNVKSLVSLLGAAPRDKVMLLTDGFWSRSGDKELKNWIDRLPPDTLRVIKIGSDANPQLKGDGVFASEDLFAALDGWMETDAP